MGGGPGGEIVQSMWTCSQTRPSCHSRPAPKPTTERTPALTDVRSELWVFTRGVGVLQRQPADGGQEDQGPGDEGHDEARGDVPTAGRRLVGSVRGRRASPASQGVPVRSRCHTRPPRPATRRCRSGAARRRPGALAGEQSNGWHSAIYPRRRCQHRYRRVDPVRVAEGRRFPLRGHGVGSTPPAGAGVDPMDDARPGPNVAVARRAAAGGSWPPRPGAPPAPRTAPPPRTRVAMDEMDVGAASPVMTWVAPRAATTPTTAAPKMAAMR